MVTQYPFKKIIYKQAVCRSDSRIRHLFAEQGTHIVLAVGQTSGSIIRPTRMMLPNCFYFVRLFFRIGITPIQKSKLTKWQTNATRPLLGCSSVFSDGLANMLSNYLKIICFPAPARLRFHRGWRLRAQAGAVIRLWRFARFRQTPWPRPNAPARSG